MTFLVFTAVKIWIVLSYGDGNYAFLQNAGKCPKDRSLSSPRRPQAKQKQCFKCEDKFSITCRWRKRSGRYVRPSLRPWVADDIPEKNTIVLRFYLCLGGGTGYHATNVGSVLSNFNKVCQIMLSNDLSLPPASCQPPVGPGSWPLVRWVAEKFCILPVQLLRIVGWADVTKGCTFHSYG